MENPPAAPSTGKSPISHLGDDLLQNIFSKLPAHSFASAACVSRTWNDVTRRVLSRPIIATALSLNQSLPEAIKEVVGKVLGGPIRPHFAILSICQNIDLDEAHRLIIQKLGSSIPLITCDAGGIIGRDALTNQFKEVLFPYDDDEVADPADYKGISLTVGYVPGLKVDVIPLLGEGEVHSIDKFAMDIRDYCASVSVGAAPEAIFLFGDSCADMKPVVEKLDYALPERTVIAGNQNCSFRSASMDNSSFSSLCQNRTGQFYGAVGLVFASDKNAPNDAWKIDFHFSVGAGVTAVGPTYRVISAKLRDREFTTWLTAKREGENETLDGYQILADLTDIDTEMGLPIFSYDLNIGITKKRKYTLGSEKAKAVTSLTYHPVNQADEQYLYVGGLDIKTGDSFRFYVPDSTLASRQCDTVSENLRRLRHKDMVGGFLFACSGRGLPYFGKPNVDSLPILDNFPGIPLAGIFCGSEIGRGPPIVSPSNSEEDQDSARLCLHVYSSIYVLISCSQPPSRP